jgi:hypothetical protein
MKVVNYSYYCQMISKSIVATKVGVENEGETGHSVAVT